MGQGMEEGMIAAGMGVEQGSRRISGMKKQQ